MKRILIAAAAAAALSTSSFAGDVGVSVSIGQPGFYGRIDIGGYPPPPVIYSRPVVIAPVAVSRSPVYLRVPPGHAKHWGKHCHEYNACGERVYFVQDSWYTQEYAPRYQERYRQHEDRYQEDRDQEDRDRGDDRRRDHDRGHGHGRGHKHGRDD